jgi:hypothetical protein
MVLAGYIKLFRDIQDNPIWFEKPFSKGQAWIDLILRANYRCQRMGPQYQNVLVKRGQFLSSNVKLADAWGWNEKSVRRFMKYLSDCGMVLYKSYSKFSVYEVSKYADFQSLETESLQGTRAEQKPSRGRAEAEQRPTNNKDNKDKNLRNKNLILEIENFRKKYSSETITVIEQYIDIIKTTRQSNSIAISVEHEIYTEMNKHPEIVVLYACKTIIGNPSHHSKKENYIYGIMRNTPADEAMSKLNKYSKETRTEQLRQQIQY